MNEGFSGLREKISENLSVVVVRLSHRQLDSLNECLAQFNVTSDVAREDV